MLKKMITIVFFVSCGLSETKESQSYVKVTNGVETSDFPSVININSFFNDTVNGYSYSYHCTATFIQHNLVLTATHCLKDGNIIAHRVETDKGAKSIKLMVNPFDDNTPGSDIALIKFPNNTSAATIPLATVALKDQDKLTLVGFGHNEYGDNGLPTSNSKIGIKRFGTNIYAQNDKLIDGIIKFRGRMNYANGNGDGAFASSGQGDSGGPLIVNGRVIGVTSGGFVLGQNVMDSYFSYVLGAPAKKFLAKAKTDGMF